MTNIGRLLRQDLRRATTNVMAMIVMAGLVVIPSLFTWFNVLASWDPFDNTQDLKVAVASADEGYQGELLPLRVNVGDQLLSALRANDQLDWEITTTEDALEGTRSDEYYAAIVLPPEFSAEMMTFYAGDANSVGIEYHYNEKMNALAPTITEQGATGVATQINETFAATLGEAGLNIVSTLSEYLNDADTQALLSRMEARVGGVATQLRSGADTAEMFTALLASSKPLISGASDTITASGDAIGEASDAIDGGVEAASSLGSTLDSAAGSLGAALAASTERYQTVTTRADEVFSSLDRLSGSTAEEIDALAARVQTQTEQYQGLRDGLVTTVRPLVPDPARGPLDLVVSRIDDALARQQALHDSLETAAAQVRGDNAGVQTTRQEIRDLIGEAEGAVRGAQDAYTTSLKPKLDQLAGTLASVDGGITQIGAGLSDAESTLSGDADSLLDALTRAESTTTSVADSLTDAAQRLDGLEQTLSNAGDAGDLGALTDLVDTDAQTLATSLSAPVELDRTPVFPVSSFGSAMTPLYTVLGLWVGALLIAVAIRGDVPEDALGSGSPVTETQAYLGRYGIVGLIGFLQSTLVTLGSILFVQVEPAHPMLLMLAGWVTSLVFTLLIYTCVAAFGNAGKAIGVLLLVIQISASGGSYPLEVLPGWFQAISPWLPATHAVDAMRSALAGTYNGDYWVSLGLLALFLVPVLLLGLVLRRPLIGYNRKLKEALESTKLM
ncbi:MAG TPA: YhgE/Pip domain-containing protein [Candidatus Dietzia intestinipullorum]|nr:YhgE/Pip domain-containing protein [Candidatus Dietzia intestinipullorum]